MKNSQNTPRCYGDHHGCYGRMKNITPVQTQNYNFFLSNDVYRTEIGSVEPKI